MFRYTQPARDGHDKRDMTYLDLPVWTRSHQLCANIFRLTRRFPAEEEGGLAEELRVAASAVPSYIVTGTRCHARQFVVQIDRAAEQVMKTAYLLQLSGELKYLHPAAVRMLLDENEAVRNMLAHLRQEIIRKI